MAKKILDNYNKKIINFKIYLKIIQIIIYLIIKIIIKKRID